MFLVLMTERMGLCPYVSLSHLEHNWADLYLILFLGAKLKYFHYK